MARKKPLKLRNPFVFQGYAGPEYFCDRTEETEELISNLQNGRNTVLISPRRIGKTGLILNTFHYLKLTDKNAKCLYIDIFATKNQRDFVQMLSSAIVGDVLTVERKTMNHLSAFFGSLRPVFSVDPLTGMPAVSVSIEPSKTETTLKSVFDYLSRSTKQIYIAIDEFQQITNYPEKGLEAQLRSYIQFAPNVHFVFSGSKRHLMSQIFYSSERPFYQSTVSMGLAPLHEEIYYDFAQRFFKARAGDISREAFHYAYSHCRGVTRNMQLVLNSLYETTKVVSSIEQVEAAIRHIVYRNSMQYEEFIGFLTDNQLTVLKAIAQAGLVTSPQSAEFINSYDLPSASSVRTAIDMLLDMDIVYRSESGYSVYDSFLELWLKHL